MQQGGEWVQLHISGRGLRNLNNLFVSDPICKVYLKGELVGQTEVQKKTLEPDWKQPIRLLYKFNQEQKLTFQVLDANEGIVGKLTELALSGENKKQLVGTSKKSLSRLMGAPKSVTQLTLENDKEITGQLIVYVGKSKGVAVQQNQLQQEEVNQDIRINWRWGGLKLLDMDFFSKSDPFAKFFKYVEGDTKILVHQTEMIKNDLNPRWQPWETIEQELCSHRRQFYVEVWDFDKMGGHDMIGTVDVDYDEIKKGVHDFRLLTAKNKKAGILKILDIQITEPPPPPPAPEPIPEPPKEITFLDYLLGGWQLSMVCGIDYTFSNGPITKEHSLHRIKPEGLNYYQQTITHIGGTIIAFDYDKYVPVYGFGGVPKFANYMKKTMDDCFPLNGNKEQPQVQDIKGILEVYGSSLPNIELSGPTFLTTLLQNAYKLAQSNAENDIYTVVLIMTDGQIEDMDDSVKVIADCGGLPMSIIIVGVGDENFKYMKQLDDINFIKKHSKTPNEVRDIVQFVSFQDFNNDVEKMSAAVLDHLPQQFMGYMNLHNIKPRSNESVHLSQMYKAP